MSSAGDWFVGGDEERLQAGTSAGNTAAAAVVARNARLEVARSVAFQRRLDLAIGVGVHATSPAFVEVGCDLRGALFVGLAVEVALHELPDLATTQPLAREREPHLHEILPAGACVDETWSRIRRRAR